MARPKKNPNAPLVAKSPEQLRRELVKAALGTGELLRLVQDFSSHVGRALSLLRYEYDDATEGMGRVARGEVRVGSWRSTETSSEHRQAADAFLQCLTRAAVGAVHVANALGQEAPVVWLVASGHRVAALWGDTPMDAVLDVGMALAVAYDAPVTVEE